MREHFDAFFNITARWHLTQAERRALLGSPTNERWFHLLHDAVPVITPEEFARMSVVLRIDQTLVGCLSDPREVAGWFRTLKMTPPFSGRTPLALLFRGIEGFEMIAEYLATRRPAARRSALR